MRQKSSRPETPSDVFDETLGYLSPVAYEERMRLA